LKLKVLVAYGGPEPACACCGERRFEFLTIDHMNGGGSKHAKAVKNRVYQALAKAGFPPGYRVLCMNCNSARGFYGFCPHEHPQRSALVA
jgi:hypothetical protein